MTYKERGDIHSEVFLIPTIVMYRYVRDYDLVPLGVPFKLPFTEYLWYLMVIKSATVKANGQFRIANERT